MPTVGPVPFSVSLSVAVLAKLLSKSPAAGRISCPVSFLAFGLIKVCGAFLMLSAETNRPSSYQSLFAMVSFFLSLCVGGLAR